MNDIEQNSDSSSRFVKIMCWFKEALFDSNAEKKYEEVQRLKQETQKAEDNILKASDDLCTELTEQNKKLAAGLSDKDAEILPANGETNKD